MFVTPYLRTEKDGTAVTHTYVHAGNYAGAVNPMRDKNGRHVPGGRRDDTCDHGLSRRRPLGAKNPPTSYKLESESDYYTKKKKKVIPAYLQYPYVINR